MATLHLILILGALVCFFLALIGVASQLDLIALGLLLWAIASCLGLSFGIVLVLLVLAALAFLIAVLKLTKPAVNWIALGLTLWMVAILLGAVLK